MKNLVNSLKALTLAGCVFVMFSCGGDTCSTCTMEGVEDKTVCDTGGVGSGTIYQAELTTNRAAGYTCTEN